VIKEDCPSDDSGRVDIHAQNPAHSAMNMFGKVSLPHFPKLVGSAMREDRMKALRVQKRGQAVQPGRISLIARLKVRCGQFGDVRHILHEIQNRVA
jgi:hypothetical protein